MHHKKGFLLLSFLLYLLLFSLVITSTCYMITALIIPSFLSIKKNQSLIAIHGATDFFVRDIKNMRNAQCVWSVMTPHQLIWQIGDHHIGWFFSDNRLERKEGIYKNGVWTEVKTSIVAKGLANALFTPQKSSTIVIGIELILTPVLSPQKPVNCYVAVKSEEKHEK